MGSFDGVWDVRRLGGALPPLTGVRKRISGEQGMTLVGPLRMSFRVHGNELHYRRPFDGFVDVLDETADGSVFRGRATFRGREFGQFELRRIAMAASTDIEQQLVQHIDEAYAMEQNVLRMLDGMISTTDDPQIRQRLEEHKRETERHAERMKQCLEAHDASPSMVREGVGIMGALMKSVADMVRTEKAGRNARDGYATEAMEIASYQLLLRIAQKAGDEQTAEAARQNLADEERMALDIHEQWDKFAELSLAEGS